MKSGTCQAAIPTTALALNRFGQQNRVPLSDWHAVFR